MGLDPFQSSVISYRNQSFDYTANQIIGFFMKYE